MLFVFVVGVFESGFRIDLLGKRYISRACGMVKTMPQGTIKGTRRRGETEKQMGRQH